jgi:hypothetical protein
MKLPYPEITYGGVMVAAKADPERQRMDIVIDQALSAEELQSLLSAIQLEARKLNPCWIAAVDMRGMWVDNPFINDQFEALQKILLAGQAGKIGTLLDNNSIKMRLLQAGSRTCSNVITRRFFDPGEWERFLSQS